jgi:hypothetical protein
MRASNEDLEVALSGGGFRAAAFGLGTLLYLVHSKLHERVKTISSVSGGSITSGYLAAAGGFATASDVDSFRLVIVRPLLAKFGGHGMRGQLTNFRWVRWTFLVFLIASAAGIVASAAPSVVAWFANLFFGTTLPTASTREAWSMVFAVVSWGVLANQREWIVHLWLWWTFFRTGKTLGGLPDLQADHVFCATDLNCGRPFFFSTTGGGRVVSEAYGRGDASKVGLTTAVRASASFPLAIPPMHFKIHLSECTHWDKSWHPRTLVLSDGGLWNNLGTDWSALRDWVNFAEAAWLRRKGAVNSDGKNAGMGGHGQVSSTATLLVADASAVVKPDWRIQVEQKLPIVPELCLIPHVLGVMTSSGLVARRAGVDASMVRRPVHEAPKPSTDEDSATRESAVSGRTIFAEMARSTREMATDRITPSLGEERRVAYERRFESQLAPLQPQMSEVEETGTTLDSLGTERVLGLIMLGYLRTREALFLADLKHDAPEIPNLEWFTSLLPTGAS